MADSVKLELNWSISDNGLEISMDSGERTFATDEITPQRVANELASDLYQYQIGAIASDELEEWEQLSDNLAEMSRRIKAQLSGVFHEAS